MNFAADTDTLFVDAVDHGVGIGTTSPVYALDVNGDINIAAGSMLKYNCISPRLRIHRAR